ncbi:hypothetical protein EON80_29840, partial [bacterium]
MKNLPFLKASLALGVLASTPAFPAPAFAGVPQAAHPAVAPAVKAHKDNAQDDYIKSLPGIDGTAGAAQTAIRRFTPLHGGGPSVYLVAAIHIGEKSYYKQIQQFLDKQSVVLYEGVGRSRSAAKTKSVRLPIAQAPRVAKRPVGMYEKVSNALNLQYQIDAIHYNRPQFRNSDLDWEAMNALATKAGPGTQQLLGEMKNTISGGPTVTETDLIMDQIL